MLPKDWLLSQKRMSLVHVYEIKIYEIMFPTFIRINL
jgi:hypothetical protein